MREEDDDEVDRPREMVQRVDGYAVLRKKGKKEQGKVPLQRRRNLFFLFFLFFCFPG